MTRDHRPQKSTRLSVLLCRDCCCGTDKKHPDFDHHRQEIELREAVAEAGGYLHRVKCLDACAHSNVVVLRTHDRGKVWLGDLVDDAAQEALRAYVRRGAVGDLPPILEARRFVPSSASEEVENRCNLRGIPVNGS